ncbi:hypothetical protein G3O08_19685 [Cryomorpha ignava]|uniref:PorT family protein n=1 Tax=Cryomorpha ignava TaxID=101383 RepID=A0A7K3WYG6_9FLAO|nr:hypothetical protein [Cryomorpha ignava]NEN25715.1 hypothetical protein [Cryomorpha ignava]
MNRFLQIALIFAAILLGTMAKAQVYNYEDGEEPLPPDSIKGLYVGLNLGFYFANKNTARIYNGYGYERDGAIISTFAQSWLNRAISGPPNGSFQSEDRTSEAMRAAPGEWIFAESDMPGEMTYRPSFMFGGHLRYMFNSDFGVFTEINGTFPVTVGQFTIQRVAPSPDPTQNQRLEQFQIRGEEQRLFINLGLHRVLGRKAVEKSGKPTIILPYFDLGATVTFAKFEENVIDMGEYVVNFNRIVDLTQFYTQQGQFVESANLLTGMGFGGFGSIGGQITLGRKFTIDIGYVANFQQVKLGDIKETGIQHQFVLKAIYM